MSASMDRILAGDCGAIVNDHTIGHGFDRMQMTAAYRRIALAALLIAAGALYLWRLDRAPVYLGWDEARTAVQGYSLATTGRDMNGARLPLLFHITDPLIVN